MLEPFSLVGAAAVPVVLLSFGMSLHGSAPLRDPSIRTDVIVASSIKLVVMPAVAFVFARFVFGLGDQQVFVLTTLGALPAAQNVFNYAQRYDAAVPVARDVVLISTIGAVPVLVSSPRCCTRRAGAGGGRRAGRAWVRRAWPGPPAAAVRRRA